MSDPSQMGPNMGAILSSQANTPGGGQSGIMGRILGYDTSEGQLIMKDQDFLTQTAGSVSFLNFGKGSIDGGLIDTVLRGVKADKDTAFSTPELGAGGAMIDMQEASSGASSDSSGSNHAFPTTMGASQGMDQMQYAGEVSMGQMGVLAPSPTPGKGASREVGMGM
jgi:hypothetical protein